MFTAHNRPNRLDFSDLVFTATENAQAYRTTIDTTKNLEKLTQVVFNDALFINPIELETDKKTISRNLLQVCIVVKLFYFLQVCICYKSVFVTSLHLLQVCILVKLF